MSSLIWRSLRLKMPSHSSMSSTQLVADSSPCNTCKKRVQLRLATGTKRGTTMWHCSVPKSLKHMEIQQKEHMRPENQWALVLTSFIKGSFSKIECTFAASNA